MSEGERIIAIKLLCQYTNYKLQASCYTLRGASVWKLNYLGGTGVLQ
jgi:hypothetical protein